MTLEHGLDNARGAVAILEGRVRRLGERLILFLRKNSGIHVTQRIQKGVGPAFLVSARQSCIRPRRWCQQRGILGHEGS